MYQVTVYSGVYDTIEMLHQLGSWVSIWMIGLWLHIIFQLAFTERFGMTIKLIKDMIIKTLGFFLLLCINVYAYASIFLMRNFQEMPAAELVGHSFYYFYNMLLGAYTHIGLL